MDLRKFHTNLFVDDSNESSEWEWIADLSDEAEFLENLRYWQIARYKFNQTYQERQKAEGRGQKGFISSPNARTFWATKGSQGFKTPTKFSIWWLPFRRGQNPLLNGTFCLLPPAFCLLQLVSLDSDYQVSFLDFLCITDSIFNIYRWATPESFYELTGLVLCLLSIQKKYILHKQNPDRVALISELPQDLLEDILKAHTTLQKRFSSTKLNPTINA